MVNRTFRPITTSSPIRRDKTSITASVLETTPTVTNRFLNHRAISFLVHAYLPNRHLRYSRECPRVSGMTFGSCFAFASMIAPCTVAIRNSARLLGLHRARGTYLALASSRACASRAAESAKHEAQTERIFGWVADNSWENMPNRQPLTISGRPDRPARKSM